MNLLYVFCLFFPYIVNIIFFYIETLHYTLFNNVFNIIIILIVIFFSSINFLAVLQYINFRYSTKRLFFTQLDYFSNIYFVKEKLWPSSFKSNVIFLCIIKNTTYNFFNYICLICIYNWIEERK